MGKVTATEMLKLSQNTGSVAIQKAMNVFIKEIEDRIVEESLKGKTNVEITSFKSDFITVDVNDKYIRFSFDDLMSYENYKNYIQPELTALGFIVGSYSNTINVSWGAE